MSNELTIHEKDFSEIKHGMGLEKATDFDFKKLISICQTYGLDPRLNQISAWLQQSKEGPKMIIHITVDAWYELANRQAAFDGIESGVIYQGDVFTLKENGSFHLERKSDPIAAVIGAYAVVYRKDRKIPTLKYVRFCEFCRDNSPLWKTHPSAMIEKVVISRAIKASFSISGIYSDEEIETMKAETPHTVTPPPPPPPPPPPLPVPPASNGPNKAATLEIIRGINPELAPSEIAKLMVNINDDLQTGGYEGLKDYIDQQSISTDDLTIFLSEMMVKYNAMPLEA